MKQLLFSSILILLFSLSAIATDRDRYDSLLSEAIVQMTHGRTGQCRDALENLLKTYRLSKTEKQAIYDLLAANEDIAGDYEAQYKYLLKKDGRRHPSSEQLFAKVLSEQPRQSLSRPGCDVTVEYYVDSLFYENRYAGCEIRLPTTVNGQKENLILDNGCAKFCVASNSFAKAHGIRQIGFAGNAVGVSGSASVWFGICDSLSVGELMFRNILFTVIPDEAINNSILEINAMLGGSIFRLCGEMVFDNENRTITFPASHQERDSNVTIDKDGIHYVTASVEGQDYPLQFDLGSARTSLSSNYFKANEKHIKECWKEKISHIGGVGGLAETTVYAIDELPITSCGGTFTRKNLEVRTDALAYEDQEYGAIGNDFLLSFRTVSVNLSKMYIYVLNQAF